MLSESKSVTVLLLLLKKRIQVAPGSVLDVWSYRTIKGRIFVFGGKAQDTWMLDVCSKACGNFCSLFVTEGCTETPCAHCIARPSATHRQRTFPHGYKSPRSGCYRHGNRCNRRWHVQEEPLIPTMTFGFCSLLPNIFAFSHLSFLRTFDSPWTKSGIFSAVSMTAGCTKWYFSTSAWQQENKEAQEEFFGRPLFELLIM